MFSWCAGYCMQGCAVIFQIPKPLLLLLFFLAGSYQLQAKSWALERLKESESASSDKAYLPFDAFFSVL